MAITRRHSHGLILVASIAMAMTAVRHGRADAPVGRYTIGNGTVLDTKTGLLWQQTNDGPARTWNDAKTDCSGLSLDDKTGWRLPSMKELQTIVDETKITPAIDTHAFLNTPNSYYWTSSPWADSSSRAWVVSFATGGVDSGDIAALYLVRCVR